MPEPQTTPLDEAFQHAITRLHDHGSRGICSDSKDVHLLALVLTDTRERLARSSRVALTDIEALFKRLEEHSAGAGEAVRIAVSAMLAPMADRIDVAMSRIETLEAWPGRLHVNGRDVAAVIVEIEKSLSELATTVAGLGTGRAASIADAEREIAKQDRAELDAALSEVARLRAELDDATSRLGLIRNDLSNQQRAARLDSQHLRQRLCQLIGTEYTDHTTVPYLLHEIEVRLRDRDNLRKDVAVFAAQCKTTQDQLDKFTDACGDQAIQIAELRTQLVRMQESNKISHSVANDVAEAEIARLCTERDAALKRCADEINTAMNRCAAATGYPQSNEDWDMVVGQIEIIARNAARMKREHDHVLGQLESATDAIEDLAAFCGVSVESREKCLRGVRRRVESLQSTVAEFKTQSEGRLEQLHQAEMALIDLAGLSIGIDAAKLTWGQCAAAIRAHIESLIRAGSEFKAHAHERQEQSQNEHAALADALGIPPNMRSTAGLIEAVKQVRAWHHEASMTLVELAMIAVGDKAAKLSRAGCVNAVRAHIESQAEQLAVADADRVPLRMDLDEARGKLERLEPVLKALHPWHVMVEQARPEIREETQRLAIAFEEWEAAEEAAQKPEPDDVAF